MTAIFPWMSCLLKQKSCSWLWKLDIEKFIFEGLEKKYGRELSQEVGILYKILCCYSSYPIVCMQGWTNNCFKMEKIFFPVKCVFSCCFGYHNNNFVIVCHLCRLVKDCKALDAYQCPCTLWLNCNIACYEECKQ